RITRNHDGGTTDDEGDADPGGSRRAARCGPRGHGDAGGRLMSQATISASPRVTDRIKAAPSRRRLGRAAVRPILMLGGILAVIVAAGGYWLTGGRVVSIDDAYVRAAKEVVSTDVSGIVASVA